MLEKSAKKPRILVAPACFKGSLSAPEAAGILQGVLVQGLGDTVDLDVCPVADGGDDTLAVLQAVDSGWVEKNVTVMGPVPTMQVTAHYLMHPQKRLILIEAAQAHGLKLLAGALEPMNATSYGVGELLRAALSEAQALQLETIVISVGGSASTDGGLGALQALGLQVTDPQGRIVETPLGGGQLQQLGQVAWRSEWTYEGRILIATDVVNPLLGAEGTARVFAPQKGATSDQCAQLEQGLSGLVPLMTALHGAELSALPGTGAAGGLAYGLRHLPRSGIVSGSQWVADALQLEARMRAADLIITGEGCFDATSFAGKATGNVLAWAGGKPVVLICGRIAEGLGFPPNVQAGALIDDGNDDFAAADSVGDVEPDVKIQGAMAQAASRLAAQAEAALPFIRASLNLE